MQTGSAPAQVTSPDASLSSPHTEVVSGFVARSDMRVETWGAALWLEYYKQCRELQSALATRFYDFLSHVSVFATAACTLMVALKGPLGEGPFVLAVGAAACLPLLVTWRVLIGYFRQIGVVGSIMVRIETRFALPEDLALLTSCRRPGVAIYGSRFGRMLVYLYTPTLMAIVMITAALLARGTLK